MLMERIEDLICTRQLQLGSNLSDMSTKTLSIKEDSSWKFKVTNAKKDKQSLPGRSIMVRTRDGLSNMEKTTEVINKEKEKTITSVF
jgi:hypothetical protein